MVGRSEDRMVDHLADRWGDPKVGRWGGPRVDPRADPKVGRWGDPRVDPRADRMVGRSEGLKVVETVGVREERVVGLEPLQERVQARARAWRCSQASMEREEGRLLGLRALVQKQVEG